jgi:hypothetical protein
VRKPIEQLSDRELDALVAEKVMEWHEEGGFYWLDDARNLVAEITWSPSTDMDAAWQVVRAIQEQHPGWRFSLLGGDTSMGYASDGKGNFLRDKKHNLIVVEDSRVPFGWHAEFFGQLDPRGDYGDRHGTARADTPARAICLAALRAVGVEEAEDGA